VRRSSAWLALAVLAAAQDDPGRAGLLQRERDRIASRPAVSGFKTVAEIPGWKIDSPVRAFKLAVIPVEFSDQKGEESPSILKKLSEYAKSNSGGALELSVEVGPVIRVDAARAVVSRDRLGSEEEGRWVTRWLSRAPADADGVCFAYAGPLEAGRQSMLWPHQTSIEHGGARKKYLLTPQAGPSAAAILCHEFMHFFGLKDKAEKETPHCILAYGYEPLLVCAACRAELGWARAARVGPEFGGWIAVREFSKSGECLRIDLVDSERLVVELRGRELLFWHTVDRTTRFLAALDGKTSDRLTPFSDPRFRGRSPGAKVVYVTGVRIEEGRALLKVSGSEPLTELEQDNLSRVGRVINPK
jgi:hypothetical protein